MLLDCPRLDWNATEIIKGLDDEKYSYQQLLFEMCLVKPNEIEDRILPEWNCLEHYTAGVSETAALHSCTDTAVGKRRQPA